MQIHLLHCGRMVDVRVLPNPADVLFDVPDIASPRQIMNRTTDMLHFGSIETKLREKKPHSSAFL